MNKTEFLAALANRIQELPQSDRERILDYYRELIDDHVEDGMTEEEAVEALGSLDDIVEQILKDTPLPKLVKEKIQQKRVMSLGEILLLVLGFPLWFPLLIAAVSLLFAFYVVIWSLIVALFATVFGVAIGGIAGLIASVVAMVSGGRVQSLFLLGGGLCCIGMTILLFFVSLLAARGVCALGKTVILGIKRLVVGKGNSNA